MKRSYQISLFVFGALFFLYPSYGGDFPNQNFASEARGYDPYQTDIPIIPYVFPNYADTFEGVNPDSQGAYPGYPPGFFSPILTIGDLLNSFSFLPTGTLGTTTNCAGYLDGYYSSFVPSPNPPTLPPSSLSLTEETTDTPKSVPSEKKERKRRKETSFKGKPRKKSTPEIEPVAQSSLEETWLSILSQTRERKRSSPRVVISMALVIKSPEGASINNTTLRTYFNNHSIFAVREDLYFSLQVLYRHKLIKNKKKGVYHKPNKEKLRELIAFVCQDPQKWVSTKLGNLISDLDRILKEPE